MSDDVDVRAATTGARPAVVRRLGSAATWASRVSGPVDVDPELMVIGLPAARGISGFTSGWGLEYEPHRLPIDEPSVWEVTSGRSSQGAVPWLAVDTEIGTVVVTVHWSGNWRFVIIPQPDGLQVSVALHPDGQRVVLGDGESLRLPEVSIAVGATRTQAAESLVRLLAEQVPPSPAGLPTEWNHWWPYEDAEIDEDTFLAEAAVAADLGLDVAVLDAGWFGRADAGSDWVAERGDWRRVNTVRFPHGLRWLADRTRERGLGFGIWIEAEAVGPGASVATEHPDLLALDDHDDPLGYVCLGSPAGQEHVHDHVARLITETDARWIKWDFNLDPGSGCRRADHGHRSDDGLLRHYLGLYATLDRLRSEHPEVIFEACSSGGLRIDAGLAGHVDGFFLSDPDWTEHHLACLWGASQLLPPRQILHWPQSEWRGEHRFQKVDYSGTLITASQFDTKIRAAMLHRFGMSVRLTQLRADLRDRLREHLQVYTAVVEPMLAAGVLVPLTEQPLREERGQRQPAYQLTSGEDHLVAAFLLPPRWSWEPVLPVGLAADLDYEVTDLSSGSVRRRSGRSLMAEGLDPPVDATSAWWSVRPRRHAGPD
ncbi:MAG TPA: glycoside hydrolase family 36 protein, partial [Microlunatus sp.]|nr:glycoside hydrolase family 36 protein [Microlunatus sp.]